MNSIVSLHRAARRPALSRLAFSAAVMTSLLAVAAPVWAANDYPTVDRVMYVQDCMRQHPGNNFEMVSKCSCALDKIAEQVPFAEFDGMLTSTNANSIGGERGNAIRDADVAQVQIKRFRSLQAAAKKSCFINIEAK